MDKLTSIARKIDVFFKVVEILLMVAFVICLVCVGIVAAALLLDIPADTVGSVDTLLSFGALNFHVAEDYLPQIGGMLIPLAMICVLAAVICFVTRLGVKTVRAILAPMKAGQPFHSEVSRNLRRLGWLGLVICLMTQALEAVSLLTIADMMKLETLLISEKITHVDVNISFDLSVLIVPAVFFLLAYVFKYGEQLQVLSDETL